MLVGTALGQMGEFGFVNASTLLAQRAIGPSTFAAVIVCVAISVAASTILYRAFRLRLPHGVGDGASGRAEHARGGSPGRAAHTPGAPHPEPSAYEAA